MTVLGELLAGEMRVSGPVSFAHFMRQALYHPELGYYERAWRVGRVGDFYTSVSSGPLFGRLLGWRFGGWLEKISASQVHLVEAGADQGFLARDLLDYFKAERPALYERVLYAILEPSTHRRHWQANQLSAHLSKVRWWPDWDAVPGPGITGILFGNEFLDALPVHRLGWDAARKAWFEWGVGLEGDSFVWSPLVEATFPLETALVEAGLNAPQELLAVLPDRFTIELGDIATAWWREAARHLLAGKLVAMDYGLEALEWFQPWRKAGTLRAYRDHHLVGNVLQDPGSQDLTAHVHWTPLLRIGQEEGLHTEGLWMQERFLSTALQDAWSAGAPFLRQHQDWHRQFQTLTHPEHLGRAFRVLVQGRSAISS